MKSLLASNQFGSQRDQINRFAQQVLPSVAWTFKTWSGPLLAEQVSSKKANAAVGPDDASKADFAALPAGALEAFATAHAQVEKSVHWPQQLATGFVNSLVKCVDACGPDQYWPIIVYSLSYRL